MKKNTTNFLEKNKNNSLNTSDEFSTDFLEVLTEIQEKKRFTPKYIRRQQKKAKKNLEMLQKEASDLSFKVVVLKTLEQFPDFLPVDNIVDLVSYMGQEWKILQEEQKELKTAGLKVA